MKKENIIFCAYLLYNLIGLIILGLSFGLSTIFLGKFIDNILIIIPGFLVMGWLNFALGVFIFCTDWPDDMIEKVINYIFSNNK